MAKNQFAIYPHPIFTPVIEASTKLLPDAIVRAKIPIAMGELIAYGRKAGTRE